MCLGTVTEHVDQGQQQVSVPLHDDDLVATAIRESREEVGVDLARSARLLGRLPRVQARARGRLLPMGITPVVFELTGRVEPAPGPEASEAFWFPLRRAARGELDEEYRYTRDDGLIRKLPSWRFEERVIWGLTYFMLESLIARLGLAPS